jgi:hypothetical protein
MKPVVIAAAACATLVAAAALAEPQSQPQAGAQGHRRMGEMGQRMQERREQRTEALRTILKLRPDQEAAFTTFQQAMTPVRKERRGPPPAPAATTPERIAQADRRMDERVAERRQRNKAILAFYAVLSPDQQKTFDALTALRGPGGMGGMGGGMGRGGRGGMRRGWAEGEAGPPPG